MERTIDNLNKVGLVELGQRVKNMTVEEKYVAAENIEIDILLDVIGQRVARYEELERGLSDFVARLSK